MDTITTIQNLLKSNGSAQPVTVALMPSETRLIAAAPDMYEALKLLCETRFGDGETELSGWTLGGLFEVHKRAKEILAKVQS